MRSTPPDVELYSRRLRRTLLLHRSADSGRCHAMVFVDRLRPDQAPVVNAVALTAEEAVLHAPGGGGADWLQIGTAMFDLAADEADAIARWLSEPRQPAGREGP